MRMDPNRKTLQAATGEYIERTAKRRGITQEELGERAGVPKATMGRYWRGRGEMKLSTLQKIFAVFGQTVPEAFQKIDRIMLSLKEEDDE